MIPVPPAIMRRWGARSLLLGWEERVGVKPMALHSQALKIASLLVHEAAARALHLDLLTDREQGKVLGNVSLIVSLLKGNKRVNWSSLPRTLTAEYYLDNQVKVTWIFSVKRGWGIFPLNLLAIDLSSQTDMLPDRQPENRLRRDTRNVTHGPGNLEPVKCGIMRECYLLHKLGLVEICRSRQDSDRS